MEILKSVQLRESVQFAGSTVSTLLAKDGVVLQLDLGTRVIRASAPQRLPIMIPLEMVKHFVLDADAAEVQQAQDAKAKADAEARAARLAEAEAKVKAEQAHAEARALVAEASRAEGKKREASKPAGPRGVTKYVKDPVTGEIKEEKV